MYSRREFLATAGAFAVRNALPMQLDKPNCKVTAKKGLAGAALQRSGLLTSWYYNWGFQPSGKELPATDASIRFVPMLWGWNSKSEKALDSLRAEHPPILFGFNEPDHTDQANLTVDAALAAWPKVQGIAADLVSPSCAQPQQEWMQRFFEKAEKQNLSFDSVGFHHYGPPEPDDFIGLLEKVHNMYKLPIWVTEFAAADWQAKIGGPANRYSEKQTIRFIQTVCPFMERTPWIRGYAWYPWGDSWEGGPLSTSAFFRKDSTLTESGEAYAAV